MSEETTLADLLQLNLHKYEDEVRNIVDKAVKESGMEKVPSARGGSCLARGTPRLVLRGGPAPTEPERHLSGASPDGTHGRNLGQCLQTPPPGEKPSSRCGPAPRPQQPARFKAPWAPSCPAALQPLGPGPAPSPAARWVGVGGPAPNHAYVVNESPAAGTPGGHLRNPDLSTLNCWESLN